ncbi:hypothetical protein ACFWB2_43365 [Streptomyces virginiae]|uniref:hypothetical protein n=1 Tax=Streptomyces virginiae TaxID=1961 RepID=UPI0036C318E5
MEKLGIGSRETLRNWVKQQEIDAGTRPGATTEESARPRALKRENAELKRANDILKVATSFFAAELDRPHTHTHTHVAFVDEHKGRFGGVEPICRVLTRHDCKIAPST